ncbi:DNA glycosylase AlkZ-like family protein [Ideonella paludis]|uniref:YcaQ family DNA glycosylase n=1 Tax=Ideonella paludis TaxID=1233411 RepID=A0ABS5DSJ8_9BURK|nr:crosslink repair DNA glycosylase YcaQ family protein [Ideonella paludis]MBQ0933876.1 YcaQ family DNA glycosylase [Ideonella paludis]
MASSVLTLDTLRRYAVARSLFTPTTLPKALARLGFVQADPLRAPARAQDLTLRHRVVGYRAGDLEARYPKLPIEEDFFVNYGFVARELHHLMHPRTPRTVWLPRQVQQAQEVLAFVRERGVVRPAEVDAHFDHGSVTNWFGGNSKASTQLLEGMHYRGLLRVARREGGQRLYAAREHQPSPMSRDAIMDALVDVIVAKYAPLPAASLGQLVSHLSGGVPQWRDHRKAALQRARARLPSAVVDGITWFWPEGENPAARKYSADEQVRLLAPFDPVVWDRRRFELLWGWAYRFEAYTPAAKRVRGHYALPLLWRDQVIGWANVSAKGGVLQPDVGFVAAAPKDKAFKLALEDELQRMAVFLGLGE